MFKNKPVAIACFLVSIISLVVFFPVLSGDFIIQDDSVYILFNPLIKQLDWQSTVLAFSKAHFGWWMPLTWLSFAVDYHFWGLNPYGYHLTNIVLHAVNAGIVVLIADQLCRERLRSGDEPGQPDWHYAGFLVFSGLLFGLHPLRVESVAWVAERKDVLNGLCAFSAIYLYLRYARIRDCGGGAGRYYVAALVLFALSLMAKSASVGLSVMLLVVDWYPLGRIARRGIKPILLEKVPFFLVSALGAGVALYVARDSSYLITYEAFPFSQRLAVSGNAIWEYWRMFFLPVGMSPLHVIPDPIPVSYYLKAAAVALMLIAISCSRRLRWLQATMLCFILPVFPVLGFFQNGDQAFAARFTYLAALAQTIAVATLFFILFGVKSRSLRPICAAISVGFLACLVSVSYSLFPVWRNTESYWTRIIAIEPLAINYKERGRHYFTTGNYAAAVADFTAALERATATLKPYAYNLYGYRAEALRMSGQPEEAVRDFTTAIESLPHPVYYYHRALALKAMGRIDEAEKDFRQSGPNPGPISWFE